MPPVKNKKAHEIRALELFGLLEATYPNAHCVLTHADPFQLVIATLLSAQCTDVRVNQVTKELFAHAPSAQSMLALGEQKIAELIKSCGFFQSKARHIMGLCKILIEEFRGEVPNNRDQLQRLPGVGRKTASVILSVAFGEPALAVDTHVARLAQRLALSQQKDPAGIEQDLCRIYPQKIWSRLHHLLIFHGRYTCKARKPECERCVLKSLCPSQASAH